MSSVEEFLPHLAGETFTTPASAQAWGPEVSPVMAAFDAAQSKMLMATMPQMLPHLLSGQNFVYVTPIGVSMLR